ncbi:hypothetical protein QVD17_40073 [Tagetes erecta]|uniref:Uncharacterized protein n=1 Tax=Tagetes erecta TaxID=13708 RepID=A0AAD8NAK7_TARER|nr:hypothetical protein QVD17_40073 [Tagetes erecta]
MRRIVPNPDTNTKHETRRIITTVQSTSTSSIHHKSKFNGQDQTSRIATLKNNEPPLFFSRSLSSQLSSF